MEDGVLHYIPSTSSRNSHQKNWKNYVNKLSFSGNLQVYKYNKIASRVKHLKRHVILETSRCNGYQLVNKCDIW